MFAIWLYGSGDSGLSALAARNASSAFGTSFFAAYDEPDVELAGEAVRVDGLRLHELGDGFVELAGLGAA